jgi:hypothetical protein
LDQTDREGASLTLTSVAWMGRKRRGCGEGSTIILFRSKEEISADPGIM